MSKYLAYLFSLALALTCAATFLGCDKKNDADEDDANEKQVDVAKIPPAAMTAIKKEIGDNTPIKRVLVGQKRGKPYYEAKYNDPAGKRMMIQVAEGLHAAHKMGLIHRDMKPGNVLVERIDDAWKAYVTDFGTAWEMEASTMCSPRRPVPSVPRVGLMGHLRKGPGRSCASPT